jgi:guanine nucleotide-binding protein subunit beta-5
MKVRRTLKGHQSKVLCSAWSSDKRHLATTAQDGKVIVWDAFASNKDAEMSCRSTWVVACAFGPLSQNCIAIGGLDNKCTVYQNVFSQSISKQPVAMHTNFVSACCFVGSDQELLTASGDKKCCLWDVESGELLQTFEGHMAEVLSAAICPSSTSQIFASAGSDCTVRIWDVRTGKCSQIFQGHEADINSVRFHPSGDAVGTAADDGSCRLFDLRANRQLALYIKPSTLFPANSIDFSLSGRLLFSAYSDSMIRIWDTLKSEQVSVLLGHEASVSCIQMSPDGTALSSCSWDGTVKIWA